MEYPDRPWPVPPNDSAGRYGHADDPGYQGFHNHATSDLYDTGGADRWSDEGDYADEETGTAAWDYWAVLLWTLGWYAVPMVVLVVRALLPTTASAGRAAKLGDLIATAPQWLLALVVGLVLAMVLRWASDAWRAITIGFCAAVVSGGALTLIYRLS